jgi:tetratricopeptide (TPR) repeat protein
VELARATFFRGERAQTDEAVDRALALTEGAPDSAERARALVAKAAYEMLGGKYSSAIETGRSTLPLVESLGVDAQRARLLDVVGVSRALSGDAGGLADSELAIQAATEAGDMFEAMVATNNLMNGELVLGRIDDARATLDRFRDVTERFGSANNLRWLASNLSEDYFAQGRWDDALVLLDRDIARSDRGFPFYLDAMNRAHRGLIREARGDIEGALSDTERAVALARTARDVQVLAPVLVMRANVLNAAGRMKEVDPLLSEILGMGDQAIPHIQTDALAYTLIDLAWLVRDVGRAEDLLTSIDSTEESPWSEPTRAVLRGNAAGAGDALERLRSEAAAAYTRHSGGLVLIAEGRTEDGEALLAKALEFHRKAGATKYIHEAEELLGIAAT